MRMSRSFVLFSVIALLAVPRVGAQDDVDDATRARAREIFQQGVASLDGGQCPDALACFAAAYDLVHEPSILYNLATAEAECHDPAQAMMHYEAFLAEVRGGRAARYRPDARRQVAALGRQLASVHLQVTGLAADDEVRVAGHVVAHDRLHAVWVAPGEVSFEVRRAGAVWGAASTTVAAGQHGVDVQVELAAPADPVPTPTEVAATVPQEAEAHDVLAPAPDRRRRRIIIGSTVAGAVVIGAVTAIVIATH